jgi:hypothetical protein
MKLAIHNTWFLSLFKISGKCYVTIRNCEYTNVQKLQSMSDFVHIFTATLVTCVTVLEGFRLGESCFHAAITLKNGDPSFVSQIFYSFDFLILFRYMTWCQMYETFCRTVSSYIYIKKYLTVSFTVFHYMKLSFLHAHWLEQNPWWQEVGFHIQCV